MADFLSDNTVWLAVVLGALAVAYGIGLTVYLLKKPAGDERMREIAAAVQEGAQAYLTRQYTIIAGVAVVLFVAHRPARRRRSIRRCSAGRPRSAS